MFGNKNGPTYIVTPHSTKFVDGVMHIKPTKATQWKALTPSLVYFGVVGAWFTFAAIAAKREEAKLEEAVNLIPDEDDLPKDV